MSRRLRLVLALASMLWLIILPGCGVAGSDSAETSPESGILESDEHMVDLIAYVDNSGDLLVIGPDGTGQRRLTGDARAGLLSQALDRGDSYSWPTWSHDGTRLAASRVAVSGRSAELTVQVFDLSSGGMSTAYTNEIPAPVADGTAHYLYWSPDDRYLSILAPTREGLALFLRDFQSPEDAHRVVIGAPLYFHWTSSSSLLAVHSEDRVVLREPAPDGRETRVAVDAFSFRAPAVSPDGSQFAFAGIGGGIEGIYVAPAVPDSAEPPRLLMETQGLVAFTWAPDGSSLAVAEQLRTGVPAFDRLNLVSVDGQVRSTVAEERMLAFFWSPQGDRIAWIALESQTREMELAVSTVDSEGSVGEPRRLFRFSPTGELFTMFSFFDQYAYSHSLWSSDGSALVITATEGHEPGRRNGSVPSGGQVYIVDVITGESRRLASGKAAFWSWN